MEQITEGTQFPAWLQRILSLALTILAVVLYVVILGSAIYRTAVETDPVFNDGIAQAAALLSGLVGSVVAAGFARSRRPSSVPVHLAHPPGGPPVHRLDHAQASLAAQGQADQPGAHAGPAPARWLRHAHHRRGAARYS